MSVAQHTPGLAASTSMDNVICECCYVALGWVRSCNCAGGPTRTDAGNVFGLASPRADAPPRRLVRPSRLYKNGIGKPVVAKRWDEIVGSYRWDVVFPPCNNFGCWIVVPEAILVGKAQDWCWRMNSRLLDAERAARAALAKATGSAA